MKNYLLSTVLLLAVFFLYSIAQAKQTFEFNYPDFVEQLQKIDIPTEMDEQALEALYHRYYLFYRNYLGDNPKAVTFEFLTNEQNVQTKLELEYLFYLAVSKGLDVSRFSVFGLHTKPDGTIHYDYKKDKHLTPMRILFERLIEQSSFSIDRKYLKQMGYSEQETAIIDTFDQLISYDSFIAIRKKLFYRYVHSIAESMTYAMNNKNTLSVKQYNHILTKEEYALYYIKEHLWRHLGLQLINRLTPKQQRIIKVFLIERIITSGTTNQPTEAERFSQKRITTWLKRVKQQMAEYNQKGEL